MNVIFKQELRNRESKAFKDLANKVTTNLHALYLLKNLQGYIGVQVRPLLSIDFGVDIDPALLTKRALTDTAFREKHLNSLRAQAN